MTKRIEKTACYNTGAGSKCNALALERLSWVNAQLLTINLDERQR